MSNNGYFPWEIDTCLMCDLLAGESWVPFRTLFTIDEVSSEILYETQTFALIADIGPIAEGHCLLIHKQHIPSFACMSLREFDELDQVKAELNRVISTAYGHPIAFEHGAATFSKNAGCCIDHAHLHLVPTTKDFFSLIEKDFQFHPLSKYSETRELAYKHGYLYYENQKGEMFLAEANTAPSQYFRRKLSHALGAITPWNWRDHIRFAEALGTKEKIRRAREKYLSLLVVK